MNMDRASQPASPTLRRLPFEQIINGAPVEMSRAVHETLRRWSGSWNGPIVPAKAPERSEQTVYDSEALPSHPGITYLPTGKYYVHDWSVDASDLFRLAGRGSTPDVIIGAQLATLFGKYDMNADGMLQPGRELDALRAAAGELWMHTGNSVDYG